MSLCEGDPWGITVCISLPMPSKYCVDSCMPLIEMDKVSTVLNDRTFGVNIVVVVI